MPKNLVHEIHNSANLYRGSKRFSLKLQPLIKSPILVQWCPPPLGWICFNSGDSGKSVLLAMCGGLFRDSQGRWFGGFHKSIGDCNSLTAKFLGVLTSLKFPWKGGFKNLIVQVDNKMVADSL